MADEVVKTRKPRKKTKKAEEEAKEIKVEEVTDEEIEQVPEKTEIKEDEVTQIETIENEMYEEGTLAKETAENISEDELKDTLESEKQRVEDKVSNAHSEKELNDDLIKMGVTPASKKMKRILYSESDIIPLGDELRFTSEGNLRKQKYIEIISSMRAKNVLTGTIISTKTTDGRICAVVSYGPFDVLIPQDMFLTARAVKLIEEEKDEREKEKRTRRLVNERIGSEVDFIVRGVDEEEGIAIGDRLLAMSVRQKAWFFGKDRKGKYIIDVGTKVEARVVASNTSTITVEFGGLEFKLRQKDIAYTRIANVADEYPVGTTVPIMFKEIERTKQDGKIGLKVVASMRDALVDNREREFRKYGINDLARATVTGIEQAGIFCRLGGLQGKQDILCKFPDIPKYGNSDLSVLPSLNDNVLVKILHKEEEDKEGNKVYRISGVIIKNV